MATASGPTGVVKSSGDKRVTLRNVFEQQRPELAKILPPGMTADRLFRMCLTECIKNPTLLECTAESWALALQTCAQQALFPDSGLGYMYLVPRRNRKKTPPTMEVSAMRGYQGDIRLARNSGEIAAIFAEVVYERDAYKIRKGLDPNIEHEPYQGEEEPGGLKATYAVAKLKSGETVFVTLTKRDVMRHRASSESADSDYSPWKKHEPAMWKKTAIHELFKWLPKDTERVEAAAREIAGEAPIDITPVAGATVPAQASGLDGVLASLPEPPSCPHGKVPPSTVASTPKGKTVVCPDCAEEFPGEAEPREPGSDDEPDPKAKGQRRL